MEPCIRTMYGNHVVESAIGIRHSKQGAGFSYREKVAESGVQIRSSLSSLRISTAGSRGPPMRHGHPASIATHVTFTTIVSIDDTGTAKVIVGQSRHSVGHPGIASWRYLNRVRMTLRILDQNMRFVTPLSPCVLAMTAAK